MPEKRRFPRLSVAVDVRWEKVAPQRGDAKTDALPTKNISAGGICLIFYERVDVGERLRLDIELSPQKTIHAVGRVVWTSPVKAGAGRNRRDVGIEFLEISKEDRQEIQRFVWSHP